MTSTVAEREVLKVKPDSMGILLQIRFTVHLLLALGLLYPEVQKMIAIGLRSLYPVDQDMLMLVNSVPAILILTRAVYLFVFETSKEYVLTDERLIVRYGIFLRVEDEVELYRVVDVTQTIGLIQRIIGVGNLSVTSTDRTGTVIMPAIRTPGPARNAIRTEAELCKNRRGSVRILE